MRPDPEKVDAILKLPPPSTKRQVRSFVNLAGYYRRFMDGYAAMTRPITLLLKDNADFYWNEECDRGFTQVKDALASEPILRYPDWSKEFYINPGFGTHTLAGILLQQGEDRFMYPIRYASRQMLDTELRYSESEKHALSLIFCVEKFKHYLIGRHFVIISNNGLAKQVL